MKNILKDILCKKNPKKSEVNDSEFVWSLAMLIA